MHKEEIPMTSLQQQGAAAKAATYVLSTAGTAKKNAALEAKLALATKISAAVFVVLALIMIFVG